MHDGSKSSRVNPKKTDLAQNKANNTISAGKIGTILESHKHLKQFNGGGIAVTGILPVNSLHPSNCTSRNLKNFDAISAYERTSRILAASQDRLPVTLQK